MKYLSLITITILALFPTACGDTNQNTKKETKGYFEPSAGTEVSQPKEECWNGSLSPLEIINLIRGIPAPCVPDQRLNFDVHCEMWWYSQVDGGQVSASVDYKRSTALREAVSDWSKMRKWAFADKKDGTFVAANCSDALYVIGETDSMPPQELLKRFYNAKGGPEPAK